MLCAHPVRSSCAPMLCAHVVRLVPTRLTATFCWLCSPYSKGRVTSDVVIRRQDVVIGALN